MPLYTKLQHVLIVTAAEFKKKNQTWRRQNLYSSSTTAVAWQNCSLPDVFVRLHPAEQPVFLCRYQVYSWVRLQLYVKGALRHAAAPVIDILFVIRMCLLSWELGADEIIPLQASHKCVSLAQMPIPFSQSHWNPALHTRTQTNTWASAPPLPPHFSPTFARFSPFLNLASAHHHGDLELAPVVARQQWLEAFSLNYVHVSQVYVLCCKAWLLTAVLISII